ncbi:MAG: NADH-quinone oxidoreductase subunit NuoH [Bacteriovoracia bacterium]
MSMLETALMVGKSLLIVIALLQVAPIMMWVERRGSAWMQKRLGPNRVGPFGLIQALADAVKFIWKEERAPGHVNKVFYMMAPMISVVPAFITFAVIPFASQITLGDGTVVSFQVANLNIGLLYILAVSSLGVYGIIMGGWASNSKYALFGSLRSSSQMISYELSMGLSIIGVVLMFSSIDLNEIVRAQGQALTIAGTALPLPAWGVFTQPLAFLIFMTAAFAETNRLPFDLPEGESEIVAGYHLEYGPMKFAVFMMAEYMNMTTASGLLVSLFFGGWQLFWPFTWILENSGLTGMAFEWLRIGLEVTSFVTKVAFFMWLFVWVRWTLPRFRYDQLMNLGWKVMLPLALANVFVTAVVIYWLR